MALRPEGDKTNWLGNVSEWNLHVATTAVDSPSADIYVKNERLLKRHADDVVSCLRLRNTTMFRVGAKANRSLGNLFAPNSSSRPEAAPSQCASMPASAATPAAGLSLRKATNAPGSKGGKGTKKTCAMCGHSEPKRHTCKYCRKCSERDGYSFAHKKFSK